MLNNANRDRDDAEKSSAATSVTTMLQSDGNGRPACFKSTVQEVLFVLTTTMAVSMSSFLIGSTTVITSFVGEDLNMTNAEITWITASSSLTAGSFLLFFGRFADLFGRKSLLVCSFGLFAVFSLVAGFSRSALFLDSFNGLLGLCSAAAVPPAVGTLGATYDKPSKRKNAAFACFSAGNPLGFVFGSISGGIATNLFNWRANFWFLAILYFICTIVAVFTVPKDEQETEKFCWDVMKEFDIVGTICIISGIALFSSSLSLAGDAPHGWVTPYILVLLILGLVLIGIFLYWESIFRAPLMALNIWHDRDFSLLMAILVLGFEAFPSAQFYLSLYLQRVQRMTALNVAVHLLPMAIAGIIVNIIAGLILHRVSNKVLMFIGAVCYMLSFLLLGLQHEDSSYWTFIFPALILTVIGADLEFNVVNMYVMSSLPRHQQSSAGGVFNTVVKLCVTIGLGIATAVFNSVSSNSSGAEYSLKPYRSVFWFSCASAGVSVLLVPFLKIGKQGLKAEDVLEDDNMERNGSSVDVEPKLPAVVESSR